MKRTSSHNFLTPCGFALYGLVAALACPLVSARVGLAQSTAGLECADLMTDSQDRFRYMAREGRCEGLYIRKNSGGASLMLLSLSEGAAQASQEEPNTMQLAWPSNAPDGVTLQQLSIRATADPGSRHYQMDVTQAFSAGSFHWSLDVLKGASIPERDVHLVGFTRAKVGSNASQLLYAPLRRGSRQGSASAYSFTLRPSMEVNDMKYAIQTLGSGGWSLVSAPRRASFGTGAAKRPFTVAIPRSEFGPTPSVHRVDFSVKLGDKSDPEPANCIVVFFND